MGPLSSVTSRGAGETVLRGVQLLHINDLAASHGCPDNYNLLTALAAAPIFFQLYGAKHAIDVELAVGLGGPRTTIRYLHRIRSRRTFVLTSRPLSASQKVKKYVR